MRRGRAVANQFTLRHARVIIRLAETQVDKSGSDAPVNLTS